MEQNKIRTYILYAIGEILLVVIGILIALQVDNWNQERIENNKSEKYEAWLLQDLYEEIAILESSINYQSNVRNYALNAIEIFEAGALTVEDQGSPFLIDLYQASQIQTPNSAVSTFQELISSGQIGMIGNDSLRASIITYYNYDWTNSDIVAKETPYRENIRKVIPNTIQSKIREACGDTYIKLRHSIEVALPAQCNLQFDPLLVSKTVDEVLTKESLKSDLRFKIGTLDGRLQLLHSYSDELKTIIKQMEPGE